MATEGFMPGKLLSLIVLIASCAGCNASNAAELAPPSPSAAAPQGVDAVPAAQRDEPSTQPTIAAVQQLADPIPTAQPPTDFAGLFDQQLLRIASDQPAAEMSSLPADERQLLSSVTDALTRFRAVARDDNALIAARTAPLVQLSDELKSQAPLAIPTLVVCRSVQQFGIYDPFEPARFTAGKDTPTIVYCEIDNFMSRLNSENRWETKLTYEAVLYNEGENALAVINKKPANIVDVCRNRRHDFFLADRMTIPSTLPVGKYLLKVTIIDQQANRVAEKALPLIVAPN